MLINLHTVKYTCRGSLEYVCLLREMLSTHTFLEIEDSGKFVYYQVTHNDHILCPSGGLVL